MNQLVVRPLFGRWHSRPLTQLRELLILLPLAFVLTRWVVIGWYEEEFIPWVGTELKYLEINAREDHFVAQALLAAVAGYWSMSLICASLDAILSLGLLGMRGSREALANMKTQGDKVCFHPGRICRRCHSQHV